MSCFNKKWAEVERMNNTNRASTHNSIKELPERKVSQWTESIKSKGCITDNREKRKEYPKDGVMTTVVFHDARAKPITLKIRKAHKY